MWKDYAIRYIKENKTSSIFLAVISLVAATLLSVICGVFYNIWADYVVRKQITGEIPLTALPLLVAYAFVLAVACTALVAMIHNAFEVSMSSRMHQLGILQSVGATPKQIKTFLMEEASVLCLLPVLVGILLGIAGTYGFMQFVIVLTEQIRKYDVFFRYHPMVAVMAFVLAFVTILISAWMPAKKISRLTPLAAIYYGGEVPVKKMRQFKLFSKLFGVYGELARKSLYARKKEMRTTTVSLTLSFLAFISFLSLETISGISTKHTYFERYSDKWDLQLVTDGDIELLSQIREINGVASCVSYQKIEASTVLPQDALSEKVQEIGIEGLSEELKKDEAGAYPIKVWLYILDDESFAQYCEERGLNEEGLQDDAQGAVAVNLIWDSINSDRMNRSYIPLLEENMRELETQSLTAETGNQENTVLTIAGYADEMPRIKEEFQQYGLTLILSETYYKSIMTPEGAVAGQRYYNIMREVAGVERSIEEALSEAEVKEAIEKIISAEGTAYTLEGRIEEEKSDATMRKGLDIIIGALALLLAAIGVANVFSATLGQVYQRKKEFARYLSVGMSPKGMRRIFGMEAVLIALRPLLLSVILNVPVVFVALQAAYISPTEFVQASPWMAVITFSITILLLVGLAYYLAGKKVCSENMIEVLKDETMI